jgi:NADH-quinone oxidoreductase subunit G
MVADAMSKPINLPSVKKASEELAEIGAWNGAAATFTSVPTQSAAAISGNQAVLTSWRRLLDAGSLQEGELNLAGTARSTVAVISPKRASALGVATGEKITISNECGSITLESLVEEIHDDAVWLPRNSSGSQLLRTLCTAANSVVTVVKA